MSFTANIPNTVQSLGFTKDPIRNNFAVLRSTIANAVQPNHIDVNLPGAGKHIFLQMPNQSSGAPNLPAINEGGLITKLISGSSELFYVRDAVNTYFQMTGPSTIASPGSIYLFGGVILKWGSFVAAGAQTFAGGAFPTNLWSLVVTANGAGGPIVTYTNVTTVGFQASAFPGNTGFYIAIGN